MSKKVFVSGNFNILHPGHLRLLRFAQEQGGELIVGVYSDELAGEGAHVPEKLRLEGVRANNMVTDSFLIEEPIINVIKRIRPDIVVKGKEHQEENNPELEVLEGYGGQLLFSSGEVVFSSLDLIKKDLTPYKQKFSLPQNFASRRGFKTLDMPKAVEMMSGLNVCVIGDLIVDEYVACDPLGMSQEDPTIVVTPVDTQRFIGGAGIVAAHASSLGAQVSFFSISGNDHIRDFSINMLEEQNVMTHLLVDESRPTTLKQRFRSHGKTLLRVSNLHQSSISTKLQTQLLEAVKAEIEGYDLIVFSDFNYGCLAQPLVEKIISIGKENNIMMVADSQSSSQTGDISRFKGMHLLTPTEYEARMSLRNHEDGLVVIAENLREKSACKNIILKLAEEGVLLHYREDDSGESTTDRLPALNNNPADVAGAGDSMLIVTSMACASGSSFWLASALGSFASALQISKLGNQPLSKEELLKALE